MNLIYVIAILIACVVALKLLCDDNEHFAGSGALVQLYAKGPEDLYLTPDVANYWSHYYPNLYDPNLYFWNVSTRRSRDYPWYLYEDEYLRSYPYIYSPYHQYRKHRYYY